MKRTPKNSNGPLTLFAALLLLTATASCKKDSGGDGISGVDPGYPVILFTDLSSAPPGAYVTLWGRNFGSSQGDSTITVDNINVEYIVTWSDEMIELQIPGLTGTGNIVVHMSEGDSPPYPFRVHMGLMLYVAPDGNDGWSGTYPIPVDGDGPLKTLKKGLEALKPGDILYVRAGTYTSEDSYNSILSFRDVQSASENRPLAIVGFPDEQAIIGDNTVAACFSLYRGDMGEPLNYLTIAKLHLRPLCTAIKLSEADYGRFVGNDISGATDACMSGAITTAGSKGWKIMGNRIHDNGNTKLEHGIYLGGYGTISDFEIAWNAIFQHAGGRGIQLSGHQPGDRIENISIHDNIIWEVDRDGIHLGDMDAGSMVLNNISIYNNILYRCGRCTGWGLRINNATADGIEVYHNTFVGNGQGDRTCHESDGEAQDQLVVEGAALVKISSNIFAAQGTEGLVNVQEEADRVEGSNNLFSGMSDAPEWDSNAVEGDPGFVDAASMNFHLLESSPAIDAGARVDIDIDHDGIKRPQGEAVDIGAYEFGTP